MLSQVKQVQSRSKVFVGMSGGVDSSVSAALLVEAGYDVTGVFIKVWQPENIPGLSDFKCTWREDRLDAMRVAAQLGIRFVTLDLEDEYKKNVVDYMIAEYRAGHTPNPDVMCNKYVKFGGFFDWAMAQGADFVATGHYARIKKREKTANMKIEVQEDGSASYDLVAGKDDNKDQSYFLWTLTQRQLARTLFPVGDIEKPQVRQIARRFGLPTAEKKDSQGLCFIGKIDIKEFLSQYIEPKTGDILDENGRTIGSHDGAFFFTIGERHGFTILDTHKTPHDDPYYVVAKDMRKNTLTVSRKIISDTISGVSGHIAVQKISLSEVNWTGGEMPTMEKTYMARPRYRAALVPIIIKKIDKKVATADVEFIESEQALSPGQSLVIYDGEVCLGGGIIS